MRSIVRFAPSPTGELHLGNARTAVVNWLFARRGQGRLILRLDDTDRERCRPEHEISIRADLAWLGLAWDEEHRQSRRGPVHEAAFARLRAGGLAYPCFESPAELEAWREARRAAGRPPLFRAEDRFAQADGREPSWRFRLPDGSARFRDLIRGQVEVALGTFSDPVIRREDGSVTYLLASIVDDLDLGVTHVIRGEDHLTNTGPQLAMAAALGGTAPAFAHLPLLQEAGGGKLSKRAGSTTLGELRAEGVEPLAVVAVLATLGTGRAPVPDLDRLVRELDLGRFSAAAPRLDPALLRRASAAVLHAMPFEQAAPRLRELGVPADAAFWAAVRPNLERLADVRAWWQVLGEPLVPVIAEPAFLAQAAQSLPEDLPDAEAAAAWLKALGEASGRRGPALYRPLRLALTAREHGPALQHLLPLLGRDRVARRLRGETA